MDSRVRVGVAISTTGDEHRLGFLETAVRNWQKVVPQNTPVLITVDGNHRDHQRVSELLEPMTKLVYRVGQPLRATSAIRHGVAVNKNTGIELLMDHTTADHLFLADDDIWPLSTRALALHTGFTFPHSMVCWGKKRLSVPHPHYGEWSWPRGVMLHATRRVIERIGGMDERFGLGGHEHAEWSRRIYQRGLTPCQFPTPPEYARATMNYGRASGATHYWHAEDIPRPHEQTGTYLSRKAHHTVIPAEGRDWKTIHAVMDERDGDTSFVPYAAAQNLRASATLYHN